VYSQSELVWPATQRVAAVVAAVVAAIVTVGAGEACRLVHSLTAAGGPWRTAALSLPLYSQSSAVAGLVGAVASVRTDCLTSAGVQRGRMDN
jgi:hypothetical protein